MGRHPRHRNGSSSDPQFGDSRQGYLQKIPQSSYSGSLRTVVRRKRAVFFVLYPSLPFSCLPPPSVRAYVRASLRVPVHVRVRGCVSQHAHNSNFPPEEKLDNS